MGWLPAELMHPDDFGNRPWTRLTTDPGEQLSTGFQLREERRGAPWERNTAGLTQMKGYRGLPGKATFQLRLRDE